MLAISALTNRIFQTLNNFQTCSEISIRFFQVCDYFYNLPVIIGCIKRIVKLFVRPQYLHRLVKEIRNCLIVNVFLIFKCYTNNRPTIIYKLSSYRLRGNANVIDLDKTYD